MGGHSQGAGHACYLAKKFQVNRVLMFSGPNDYSDLFSISANWLRKPGLTPVNQHYSYLSLNDEAVDYAKQFANITGLGMLVNDDSTHVDQWQSPFNNSHCLYTTQKPGIVLLNHNVPVKFSSKNNDVWDYMLTSSNSIGISRLDLVYNISVYPNPSHFIVYLRSKNNLQNKFYTLHDLQGKIHSSGTIEDKHEFAVDLTDINVGIYILKIEHVTLKIVKE